MLAANRRKRRFPDWTMAFADVTDAADGAATDITRSGFNGDLEDVEGYNDVLDAVARSGGEESQQFSSC